jgi:hypothetical protein
MLNYKAFIFNLLEGVMALLWLPNHDHCLRESQAIIRLLVSRDARAREPDSCRIPESWSILRRHPGEFIGTVSAVEEMAER